MEAQSTALLFADAFRHRSSGKERQPEQIDQVAKHGRVPPLWCGSDPRARQIRFKCPVLIESFFVVPTGCRPHAEVSLFGLGCRCFLRVIPCRQVIEFLGATQPPIFTLEIFAFDIESERFVRVCRAVRFNAQTPQVHKTIKAVTTNYVVLRGNYSTLSLAL